ncbi:hypothetical protein ACFL2U_03425, partial [Patescibacteria group bacterium]
LAEVIPTIFTKLSFIINAVPGFSELCANCGYRNNHEKLMSDISRQIQAQLDPQNENSAISLFLAEWLIVHAFMICFKTIFEQQKNEIQENELLNAFSANSSDKYTTLDAQIFIFQKLAEEIELHVAGVPENTLLM